MSSLKKPLTTPALLPWIPPGRAPKKSFNSNAYKKNEGVYDFGASIANDKVFSQTPKQSVSLSNSFFSLKKNSRKLTLGPDKERRINTLLNSSANSDVEREYLRSKILEIFEEEELKNEGMEAIAEEESTIKRSKSEPDLRDDNKGVRNHDTLVSNDKDANDRSSDRKDRRDRSKDRRDHRSKDRDRSKDRKDRRYRSKDRNHSKDRKHHDERSRDRRDRSRDRRDRSRDRRDRSKNNKDRSRDRKDRSRDRRDRSRDRRDRSRDDRDRSRHRKEGLDLSKERESDHKQAIDRHRHARDHNRDEGYDEEHYEEQTFKRTRKTLRNDGHGTYRSDSSGFDSMVEDLEDRASVKFIDSYDANHQTITNFSDPRPTNTKATNTTSYTVIDDHNHKTWYNTLPNHKNRSVASSAMGFTSVPLEHMDGSHRQYNSLPAAAQAWVVFPKDGSGSDGITPRSFTARPLNFAASIGSRLKNSFTNINRVPTRETPIEAIEASDQAELIGPEEKELDRRKGALIAGAVVAGIAILILIIVGLSVGLSASGNGVDGVNTGSLFLPTLSKNDNSSIPCTRYTTLNQKWRRIVGYGPSNDGSAYNCDYPGSKGRGGIKPGWHRFEGEAGTYLPTKAPSNLYVGTPGASTVSGGRFSEVCGTSLVAWLNGQHPTVRDGIVERVFCFQWTSGECEYSFKSKVRTCPDPSDSKKTFYVYYLKFPRNIGCNFGFCAVAN